jgi:hypothetical protein
MMGSSLASIVTASAMLAAGIVFGLGYFAALRWTIGLYGAGRSRVGPAAITLARVTCAVILFFFAARLGALPLFSTFLGFLLARALTMHVVRRAD